MGGGDLNLKKSWHPTTLRNMERVWKAEQKHEAECKKIEELQKELQEERDREEIRHYAEEKGVVKKKADRLDWMYDGPASHVNREEYLLGRTVDKTFELLQEAESGSVGGDFKTEGDTMPESILKTPAKGGNVTVDLANKIREDPLLAIKKQEEHNRKELLENPIRMKQLQQMLQEMTRKKRDKNKKKRKKNKRRLSSSSDDVSSGEDKHIRKKHKKSKKETQQRHSSPAALKASAHRLAERKLTDSGHHHNSDNYRWKRSLPPQERSSKRAVSNEQLKEMQRRKYSQQAIPREGLIERTRQVAHGKSVDGPHAFTKSRKMDAVEREKRLKEMVSNAQWRDEQRDTNMKRHLSEVKTEEEMEKSGKVDIMTPMLSRAANISTVESRIKSKIYNIQRSKIDLEKNFIKR